MRRSGQSADTRLGRSAAAGNQRVLLVAHNLALLLAVRAALAALGLRVTAVRSIEESLAILNRMKEPIELLVLDADLSTPVGCEKLAALFWGRSPDARVLLLSSSPAEGISNGLAQGEKVKVLLKPFRVEELEAVCRELLSG